MATKRKPKKEDLTFILGAVGIGTSLVKNGYAKMRYSMMGNRIEDIKVKKIVKGTSKAPSLSVSKSSFVTARLNSLPLGGNAETWIIEAANDERYLIGQGNLSLKRTMKVGEVYRCKVFGDPDWGIPKIVEMIGNVKELSDDAESNPDSNIDDTLVLGEDD